MQRPRILTHEELKALENRKASADCSPAPCSVALSNVLYERKRQDEKWGIQDHHPVKWHVILSEEVGESCQALLDGNMVKYRDEMVQVAAVAIAAVEAYDRAHSIQPPNRYSAKPRFGLIRERWFAGFGLCGCNRPRYEEMTIRRFGLIRAGGFGTWHGTLGTAPHLEQCGLLGLNWATIFSLALDNNTVF